MIRWIIGSSLKLRLLVVAIAIGVVIFGITQLGSMSVDVLPEFEAPSVEIRTEALGLSADEVEQFITVPMEQDLLNGVAWLDDIRSESIPGLSSIVLTFEPGTDLIRARQMVAERLTQAAVGLPHVSKPPTMLQPLSSTSRVMMIGLSSKDVSLIEMSVLARWTIVPRLMGVPGVANVATWGFRDRQLQVQVDPKRLKDKGVSLLQVLETTGNAMWVSSLSFVEASTPGTGGFIDTSNQRLGIRHIFPISSPEGLAQVPIEDSGLRLGDVTTVVEDHQPLIGDAITNEGPGLILVVEKFPGANTLEVTHGVEDALAALRPGLPGIAMDSGLYRPANFIETAINNLTLVLIVGFVLLVLVLGAFLFEWRTALISLIAIPLSLFAGGLVLYVQNVTVNIMILAGFAIAVGVVVDDAIIDVENIMRRLRVARRTGNTQPTTTIVLEAALEARSGTIYATLIILLAVVPVLFIGGLVGAFLQPLVWAYGLAVLASMLVALTVTPALCLVLLSGKASAERRESPLVRGLQRGYERALAWSMGHPRWAFGAMGLLIVVGVAVFPFLGQSLFPQFKERDLLIHLNGAPGTSQPEMDRIVGLVSQQLQAIPGVRDVGAHVGRAVMSDQVVDVNSSELWVSIDPAADYDTTRANIKNAIQNYPGLYHDVQTYLDETAEQVAADTDDALVVRVYGDSGAALRNAADQVKQALTRIDGIVEARVNLPVEVPQVQVLVDLAAAQRYGLKPGDVRRASATLLSGIQVGNLFEEQKVFDVVVWGTPETRTSLSSVRDLLIDTPSGAQVRLGDIARVSIVPGPIAIQHESVKRFLDVAVTVQGRDAVAVVADIERRLPSIAMPLEFHAEVLKDYVAQQADQTRLLILGLATAVGIFLLLQAAFGSWRLATLSFLTLPAALVGGVLATFAGPGLLSLGSLVGLFTVLGITARNGILLITHYQQLERDEGEAFGPGLILRGARERLSPILMTALALGLGMLPLVLAGDLAGLEIAHPMAIVIVGGLVTSTLVNLFVVPALYLSFRSSPAEVTTSAPVPAIPSAAS
jgi:CzcA family heavy metal efflux pump